jgi:hypothetical protein
MDRIEINGVWYVKEDTIQKESIILDPTHFEGYSVENDDFSFEATIIFKDDDTPYEGVTVECTDKRFPDRSNWKVEYWDNDNWLRGILNNDIDSWKDLPDMGKQENTTLLLAFLQYLKNKEWL